MLRSQNWLTFEMMKNLRLFSVSSGSIAVHPDASVQLLAEEATLVENLDAKVKERRKARTKLILLEFSSPKMPSLKHNVELVQRKMINRRPKRKSSWNVPKRLSKRRRASFNKIRLLLLP